MKKTLFSLLALGALLPAHSATVCKDYEEAAAGVTDDGYITFVYGPDWDKRSTALCRKLISNPALQAAAGDARLILTPIYQDPNEGQKAMQEKAWGKLALPHPHSAETYPALHFYSKDGRLAGFVRGRVMARGTVEEITAAVAERMANVREQYALLQKAESATGVEKAKLIGQACCVPETERPDKVLDTLKALDPKDESGYIRRLSLGGGSEFGNANRNLPLEEGLAQMDKNLKDSAYTDEQKQIFCALAIGLIHRQGTKADNARMTAYAKKMKELAPNTVLGRSADIVVNVWQKGLTLDGGWNKDSFPDTPGEPVELLGKLPIKKAGTYTVTFQYGGGADALLVKSVELRDSNGNVLAKDEHEGFAGRKPNANVYTLPLEKTPKGTVKVFVTFGNSAKSTDTAGSVIIGKLK